MKIALYIEDGFEQIVLTPQGDSEKAILGKLHEHGREMTLARASFYHTRGQYLRQGADDESTLIILQPKAPAPERADT